MEIRINLLPWDERIKKVEIRKKIRFLFVLLSLFLTIVFLINSYTLKLINQQIKANLQLQQEIAFYNRYIAEITILKKQQKILLDRINFLQGLQNDRLLILRFLVDLVKLVPEEIYLKQLKSRNKKISLQAKALSNDTVSHFLRQIEHKRYMGKAILKNRKKSQFSLSFRLHF